MSQWIRRPAVGLALGGGGARGLAHIGVLMALQNASIPIDCLAGSSMGGLIAGLFAAGVSTARLQAEALRLSQINQLMRLMDFRPPRRGLLSTERLRTYLAGVLGGDTLIEDLPLPLALTAVDLVNQAEVVIRSGSLIEGIMATTCVPGLFPPVELEGRCLVDGGVLNNVPADVVRDLGAELVVAVDVNEIPAGEVAWGELAPSNRLERLLPAFAYDIYAAETIMIGRITETRLKAARPDLVIRPPIPAEVNVFFGFTHAPATIACGEEATLPSIAALQKELKPGLRLPGKLPIPQG